MRYKHIIFDFDGVLADSNNIRLEGFRMIFKDFPEHQVQQLIEYAKLNGGISRYEKIRYFFEQIRNESIFDDKVQLLAKRYSELVKQNVIDAAPVKGSLNFLSTYHDKYDFAVVSGSDQEELREVCKARKIEHFFVEILGSPTTKESNIDILLKKTGWGKKECLFVGDSINDYDAARKNDIDFLARNTGLMDWGSVKTLLVLNDLSELDSFLKGE